MSVRHPALRMLFAIPNGAYTGAWRGQKLVAAGLERGVPDVFLAYPSGARAGLFIEFKTRGRRPTPDQVRWHDRLRQHGYHVVTCYSALEAQDRTLAYLGIDRRHR
jgi:hypothetical protein